MRQTFFIICLLCLLLSCANQTSDKPKASATAHSGKKNMDSLGRQLNANLHFISDSLLPGKALILERYIHASQPDSCGIIAYTDRELRSGFEGIKDLGDINGDKIPDTVFVIPPFNFCDEGYSYSFFDTTLPRMLTDSYCCHPDNLFSVGDIDEDGIAELCRFHSVCTSRFKSLRVYSLKGGQWKQVGDCTFDIAFVKPVKEERVRKIARGKFEMLEITDKENNKQWKPFSF